MSKGSDTDFDAVMRQMGVTKRVESKKTTTRKAKPKVSAKARPTAPKPVKKAVSTPAKAVKAKPPKPDPRLKKLETELATVQAAADEKIAALEKALADSQAVEVPNHPTLTEALGAMGFKTGEEVRDFLALPGVLDRLVGLVTVPDPSILQDCLPENTMRICEHCPVPADRVRIAVKSDRCEYCGGVNIKDAARRFLDACLVNGRRRVVIVGRSPKEQRLLRNVVHDSRVVLTLVSGTEDRDLGSVKTDVTHADAVILWDAEALAADVRSAYEEAPRSASLGPVSIGTLLIRAAEVITAD